MAACCEQSADKQTRNIKATFPLFIEDGNTRYYKGKASAPFIPSFQGAYKKGDWTISGSFRFPANSSKLLLATPETGHARSSGLSSKGVPGGGNPADAVYR